MNETIRAAGVRADPAVDMNSLLAAFAAHVARDGARVRGLLQERVRLGDDGQDPQSGYALLDLHTGERFPISQYLGPGSASCRLDPAGVAEAGRVLRAAVSEGADLVIVSKFGKLEAEGDGLADDLLAAMAEGLAVLVVLDPAHLGRWNAVTGGGLPVLAPDLETLSRWWQGVRQ